MKSIVIFLTLVLLSACATIPPVPETELTISGTIRTENPESIRRRYSNRVNAGLWHGGATGTWLCTEVSHDQSQYQIKFIYASTRWTRSDGTYNLIANFDGIAWASEPEINKLEVRP